MAAIEVFTFGYWGWGSETDALVEGIDAVETARGFKPPLFVDIRISRSVRAKGFDGKAFEKLLGPDRYVWMNGLGNDSILSGGRGIKIHDPSAAVDLLDLAIASARQQRRVIFYCACEEPGGCHRKVAGDLLLAAARKREVVLVLDEWPGGEPTTMRLAVPPAILKLVQRGRKSIPLPRTAKLAEVAGLPWGSTVEVAADADSTWVVSGPARASAGKWSFPVIEDGAYASEEDARAEARNVRVARGYGRRDSRGPNGSAKVRHGAPF